ncbi:MAG: hypothetical protein QM727_05385 [Niabella sp.]
MHSHLVVTPDNQLQETQPFWLRWLATIFSYVFHPVFVPVYVMCFLLFVSPFLFVGFPAKAKVMLLAHAFLMYTFFPLITVALLKALGFISSIRLNTQKDRIIPFIASGIWYFWVWYVWRNMPGYPSEIVVFAMSVFVAASIGLIANIYMKISMHAIAVSTATAFMCFLGFRYGWFLSSYIMIALIVSGCVCSARLILGDHDSREIYWGVFTGVVSVLMAQAVFG